MTLTAQAVRDIFSSQPARLTEILANRVDVYTALARVARTRDSTAYEVAAELLGDRYLRELADRVRRTRSVSPAVARQIRNIYLPVQAGAPIRWPGTDQEMLALIGNLGDYLQSDHLLEQRFIDAIAEGVVGASRPRGPVAATLRDAVRHNDALAIPVPTNEIIYTRIARRVSEVDDGFQLAGLYPHVGPGSKTSRLAELIPPGTESALSLADLATAQRFVLFDQLGLHRPTFEILLLQAMATEIEAAIAQHPRLRRAMVRATGTSEPNNAAIVRYLKAGGQPGAGTFRPDVWPYFRQR